MKTLTFEQLPQTGFAGLLERRFVINQQLFGRSKTNAFAGLGNFVYLADANFLPFGETRMHSHQEVDVISVMVEGEIAHQGSLGHGERLTAGSVQVQRAGAEGFNHNEVNPNAQQNQMIQLWVLPDDLGEQAGYKVYQPDVGQLEKVYGGDKSQDKTFNSKISIAVSNTEVEQNIKFSGEVLGAVDLCLLIQLRVKIALVKAKMVQFSHLNQSFSTQSKAILDSALWAMTIFNASSIRISLIWNNQTSFILLC